MSTSRDLTIKKVTNDYLDSINVEYPPKPADIVGDILANTRVAFDIHNASAEKGEKWRFRHRLSPTQLTDIMLKLYPIAMIQCRTQNGSIHSVLGIYQEVGEDKGIYITNKCNIFNIANEYCYGIGKCEGDKLLHNLRSSAPKVWLCEESHLVSMNNGIYNKNTKELMPFTPDLVFLEKSDEDYNPNSDEMLCE